MTGGGVALVAAVALLVPWCTVRGVLASMSGAWEVGVGRCLVLLLPVVTFRPAWKPTAVRLSAVNVDAPYPAQDPTHVFCVPDVSR